MTKETKKALEDAGIGWRTNIAQWGIISSYKNELHHAQSQARLAESNAKSPSLQELKSALKNEDAKRIAELERDNLGLRAQLAYFKDASCPPAFQPLQFYPPIKIFPLPDGAYTITSGPSETLPAPRLFAVVSRPVVGLVSDGS